MNEDILSKSWSEHNKNKEELMGASDFWSLPLTTTHSKEMAANIINKGYKRVLEIGAGDRGFSNLIEDHIKYLSFDIDKNTKQDFYNIEEIKGKYDVVVMFAVIEHLSLKTFIKYLEKIKEVLKSGGYLIISTNNIFHNIGIRADLTHLQAYSPRDLNSLLMLSGFNSGVCYRITQMNIFFRTFYSILSKYILRPYRLDFAPEICLINKMGCP